MRLRKFSLLRHLVHVVFFTIKCFQKENRCMNSSKMTKKDFIHMLTRQKNNINLSLSFLKKLNQRACNSQELT